MADRPRYAAEYSPEEPRRVREMCLCVATILGDYRDHWAIVGGFVPGLRAFHRGARHAERSFRL